MTNLAARILSVLFAIAIDIGVAAAQPKTKPAQRPVPGAASQAVVDDSKYCVSGSAGFLTSEEQGIESSRLKCKSGDTIIIPAARTRIIARLCDFTRTIATAEANVVCVLTGTDRAER
jgi:hypothetical protein